MSKKMATTDFRAVRTVLEASDFALAPRPPESPANDMIDNATWERIQTLPETVSIFTSNDHGRDLSLLSDLWGWWVETLPTKHVEAPKQAVYRACLTATDEFQAATFNALHGFYRVVADSLRSAVEQMTIGVNLELEGDAANIGAWLDGKQQFLFNGACVSLQKRFKANRLRLLFQQKDGKNEKGWVRSLHKELSEYSHARPGFDALHLWKGSNGPVYVNSAFQWSVRKWLLSYATCVILLKLVRPELPQVGEIFSRDAVFEEKALRRAAESLWAERTHTA